MDNEKAFEFFDHDFLSFVLRKFGFRKNFITWIEILLKDQHSCVLNGDPISVYLFIVTLEVLFLLIKTSRNKRYENIEHCFLYTVYVDDTMFFLNNSQCIYLAELFNTFSVFLN